MAIDSIGGAEAAASFRKMQPARQAAGSGGAKPAAGSGAEAAAGAATREEELRRQLEIDRLKAVELAVIAHERAHKGAGGAYAGAVSYSYTTGPDGKRYISGGEVSIDVSSAGSPEATVRKMRQVAAAALAPADPSAQDYRVASQARVRQAEAQREVAAGLVEERGGGGEVREAGEGAGEAEVPPGAPNAPPAVAAYGAAAALKEGVRPPAPSVTLYA
jgi:hypothetical protein